MSIPKITHQIWFQGWDKLPTKYEENVALLESMNKNFKHMKWDEQSLRKECAKISDAVVKKFDSFPYMIQKIDFGRYVVLYNYGGISVDTDMKSLKSLEETPSFYDVDFIVSHGAFSTSFLEIVNNALIMCKQNHQIMLELIQNIIDNNISESYFFSNHVMYIFYTTGPLALTIIVNKYRSEVLIIDRKYFEPRTSFFGFTGKVVPESIMDHHLDHKWGDKSYTGWLMMILVNIIIIVMIIAIPYYIWKFISKLLVPTKRSNRRSRS